MKKYWLAIRSAWIVKIALGTALLSLFAFPLSSVSASIEPGSVTGESTTFSRRQARLVVTAETVRDEVFAQKDWFDRAQANRKDFTDFQGANSVSAKDSNLQTALGNFDASYSLAWAQNQAALDALGTIQLRGDSTPYPFNNVTGDPYTAQLDLLKAQSNLAAGVLQLRNALVIYGQAHNVGVPTIQKMRFAPFIINGSNNDLSSHSPSTSTTAKPSQ